MSAEPQPEAEKRYPVGQSMTLGGSAAAFMALADVLAHLGPTGLLLSGLAGYVAYKHGPELLDQVRGVLPERAEEQEQEAQTETISPRVKRGLGDRLLGRYPEQPTPHEEEDEPEGADTSKAEERDELEDLRPTYRRPEVPQPEEPLTPFTQPAAQTDVPGVRRITIDEIVQHTEPNSFKTYIGRSMTRQGNPAMPISFYKRHMKLIGASQYGKSSMAAALLDIITRTHDPEHVRIALLDMEDQTSKLFARIPHLAQIVIDDQPVTLHARTPEQVLEYLGYIIETMNYRYTLSKSELMQEPVLIVYLEEFLALKDYFKTRIDAVSKDEKEQARQDYAQLIFGIKEIARRGLKVLVQLLMCAQCDYRDDDLQEALINVTAGMSFCVRVSAAQAAGFYQTELLQKNVKMDMKGLAVVEMPDCKDMVLAPQYDLEQRLIALEKREMAAGTSRRMMGRNLPTPPVVTTRQFEAPPMESVEEEMAKQPEESDLERALKAYDAGNTTVNALAIALGMTPWTVRPLYTQVKKLRENAG